MPRLRWLVSILGLRVGLTFGAVTFLVAALLATVNITSRYALKLYVEDQLRRIRWDVAVYQKGTPGSTLERLPDALRAVEDVQQVETLAFLRAEFPRDGEVGARADDTPITTPWISLLAASDLSILPPQLGLALTGAAGALPASDPSSAVDPTGAVLALVGPEREIGRSLADLQNARQFSVDVKVGQVSRQLFAATVRKTIRLERDELNRWLMDQTGSVTYIPHIGLIVAMPFRIDALQRFDSVAAGLVPQAMLGPEDAGFGHVHEAEYEPEVAYLARFERDRLVSGWDIGGSLARVADANHRIEDAAFDAVKGALRGKRGTQSMRREPTLPGGGRIVLVHDPRDAEERKSFAARFIVDSTTEVLLGRMDRLARLVGVVTLLVSLPLLSVAWLLAANLAGLLMLNERRTLGLLRLRGVSGTDIGRALLISIVAGGLGGGMLGVITGSVMPLAFYEGGRLPREVLLSGGQIGVAALLLAVSVLLSYLVSRRLVRYATTISPLEAAARIARSETGVGPRFRWRQALALGAGALVIGSWILGVGVADVLGLQGTPTVLRLVDFTGLPLFIYGLASLLASRRRWLDRIMSPMTRLVGGPLGKMALRHGAAKPHRALAFLLIVALMASVSLYPTITSGSFQDKAVRGARVQIGTDWQLLFNAPDLVPGTALQGGLHQQLAGLRPAIREITSRMGAVPGVTSVTYLVEAVLPNFFMPEYGLRGVPAYIVDDVPGFQAAVYSEPELGLHEPFADLVARLEAGDVLVSQPVAQFKKVSPGQPLRLGVTSARTSVTSTVAGVLGFLPGIPTRTVTDRQGYVQARIDYLNYLFSENAYVVAAGANPKLADLRVQVPRVIVLARGSGVTPPADLQHRIVSSSPIRPLEVHNVSEEIGKVSSDMYISLALANMRIYLIGGMVLALIAIVAVASANYVEDRRTLGLLRVRGASPREMRRFVLALLVAPALVGLAVGAITSLTAGYGLANHVWELREIRTVVQLLPTRLVVSPLWGGVAALQLSLLIGVASLFSAWVYRRTAHQSVHDG